MNILCRVEIGRRFDLLAFTIKRFSLNQLDTEFKQVVSLVWACSTVLPVQTIVASSAYLTSKASIILESRSLIINYRSGKISVQGQFLGELQ